VSALFIVSACASALAPSPPTWLHWSSRDASVSLQQSARASAAAPSEPTWFMLRPHARTVSACSVGCAKRQWQQGGPCVSQRRQCPCAVSVSVRAACIRQKQQCPHWAQSASVRMCRAYQRAHGESRKPPVFRVPRARAHPRLRCVSERCPSSAAAISLAPSASMPLHLSMPSERAHTRTHR
jgi:hypothetical protein